MAYDLQGKVGTCAIHELALCPWLHCPWVKNPHIHQVHFGFLALNALSQDKMFRFRVDTRIQGMIQHGSMCHFPALSS